MIKDKKQRELLEQAYVKEFKRISKLLTPAFTQADYVQYSNVGLSLDNIRRALGYTFNEFKVIVGLTENKKGILPRVTKEEVPEVTKDTPGAKLCGKCERAWFVKTDENRSVCPPCKAENFKGSD